MPYWRLFYHLVWATKNRHPWITQQAEPILYEFIRTKAIGLGATVFALNGIEDHVHMVAAIPPKIAVASFIGQVKGVASFKFNEMYNSPAYHFAWQEEYGVYSFDRRRLPNLIDYVERQRQLHKEGHLIPTLERTHGAVPELIGDPDSAYYVDSRTWRQEMMALDTELFK